MLRNATRFAAVMLCTLALSCNRSSNDSPNPPKYSKLLKIWIQDFRATSPSFVFQGCGKWASKFVGCSQTANEDAADIRIYSVPRPGGNYCPEPSTVFVSDWTGNMLEVTVKKVPSSKYQDRGDGNIYVYTNCDRESAGFSMAPVTFEQVLDGQIAIKAKLIGS